MSAPVQRRHLAALAEELPASGVGVDEVFAQIPGYPGYLVGDAGTVLSFQRRRVRALRGQIKSNGYVSVNLVAAGKVETKTVHPLVAEAFIGPRAAEMLVCHGDGTRTNNRVENLRWGTRADNYADALRHGTVQPPPSPPQSEVCKRGHLFDEPNTRIDPRGFRVCRACKRLRDRIGGAA